MARKNISRLGRLFHLDENVKNSWIIGRELYMYMADIEVDKVADIEVNMVADMEMDMVADMEVDKLVDMLANMVVDEVAYRTFLESSVLQVLQ